MKPRTAVSRIVVALGITAMLATSAVVGTAAAIEAGGSGSAVVMAGGQARHPNGAKWT